MFAKKIFLAHRLDIMVCALLLFVALLPRILNLGTFLTTDEKTWMARSYDFVRAFHDLRFNDMLQTTHPGVTTLWVAGAAITTKMLTSHIPFEVSTLFHFVKASQFSIAALNTLIIPALYVLLRIVLKRRDIPLFAVLLLALDPFLIGYSRVVHVDALLGGFLTLAVLATIVYVRSLQRGWLIASAALAGLALLTKIPAVFIFPFIIVTLAIYYGKKSLQKSFLVGRVRDAIVWVLIVGLMIVIIWPALVWVPNPLGNALVVQRDVSIAASTPHDMNEEYTINPFHYPAALLTRSNPVTLIGGALGVIAFVYAMYKKKSAKEMGLVIFYFVGFIAMMTFGAKKGDRYIIPSFFALDIIAAYGILWALSLIKRYRNVALVGTGVSLLYLASVVVFYHPYEISYSNPFFPDNLSQELGWGEGLDQVAAWLNTNYPHATAASWYPGELQAFTTAQVLHINAHEQNQVQFIVLYRNMFGREPSHYANDFIDEYYKKREPVHVVYIAGKEFAWIYEKPSYAKTVGDMDNSLVIAQEVVADHENFAGFEFLPATRFGKAGTGTMIIDVARSLTGTPIFSQNIPLAMLKDKIWEPIGLPSNISVNKGDHLFIRMRVQGATDPYASIRYSSTVERSTPIYISRTGSIADATQKPGSLAIQLQYIGTDGKLATELETRLLR